MALFEPLLLLDKSDLVVVGYLAWGCKTDPDVLHRQNIRDELHIVAFKVLG